MNNKYTSSLVTLLIVLAIAGIIYYAGHRSQSQQQVQQAASAYQSAQNLLANPPANSSAIIPNKPPAATPVPAPAQTASAIKNGTWGGQHITMTVSSAAIALEFDCAHGSINQPVKVDAKGSFSASGSYTMEHGGPIRVGEAPNTHPANYSGTISGASMTLNIILTDTKQTMGSYSLAYGSSGMVFKCL
jgi:Tfp pilus assembly protein PilV